MIASAIPRVVLSLSITIGAIATACHRDGPGPVLPLSLPLAPEVSREAPKSKPIEPKKHQARKVRVSDAPVDAGVSDAFDLPPVPDADVDLVPDAGQPLR